MRHAAAKRRYHGRGHHRHRPSSPRQQRPGANLKDAAEGARLGVFDVLLVTGNEWRSLHRVDPECQAQQGNPLPTGPTAVDAAAVYAGLTVLPSREALAAMFTPVPGRPSLSAELQRHWRLRDAAGEDGG